MTDVSSLVFFFQAEDGIRGASVTGVQTCALPISRTRLPSTSSRQEWRPCLLVEQVLGARSRPRQRESSSSALAGVNPAQTGWKRCLRALRPEGAENQVAL